MHAFVSTVAAGPMLPNADQSGTLDGYHGHCMKPACHRSFTKQKLPLWTEAAPAGDLALPGVRRPATCSQGRLSLPGNIPPRQGVPSSAAKSARRMAAWRWWGSTRSSS